MKIDYNLNNIFIMVIALYELASILKCDKCNKLDEKRLLTIETIFLLIPLNLINR